MLLGVTSVMAGLQLFLRHIFLLLKESLIAVITVVTPQENRERKNR